MAKFKTGISYDEPIKRLNSVFSPKIGDLLEEEKLAAVIQADPPRFYGVVRKWMKDLRERKFKPVWRRGEGLYFQSETEALGTGHHKLKLTGKRVERLDTELGAIDGRQLNAPEQASLNLMKRLTSEQKKEFKAVAKEAKPPAPTPTANLRVIKSA